jgi:hypothetical protein
MRERNLTSTLTIKNKRGVQGPINNKERSWWSRKPGTERGDSKLR